MAQSSASDGSGDGKYDASNTDSTLTKAWKDDPEDPDNPWTALRQSVSPYTEGLGDAWHGSMLEHLLVPKVYRDN